MTRKELAEQSAKEAEARRDPVAEQAARETYWKLVKGDQKQAAMEGRIVHGENY